ncbi:MAG: hypothetical protein H0T89_09215, partial [Deltaproteobacteria bacterium]|nr:hypothetical protein [Deltaproteobacteria bacterium]
PPPLPPQARSGELAQAARVRQASQLLPAVPSMIVSSPSSKVEMPDDATPPPPPLPSGVKDLTANVPVDTWMANPETDLLSKHRMKGLLNLVLGLVLLGGIGVAIFMVANRMGGEKQTVHANVAPVGGDAGAPRVVVDAAVEIDAMNSMSKDDIVAISRFGFFSITASAKTAIWVDGKLIGDTPLTRLPLTPGPHKIKAVGPRGKTKTLNVTIYGGKDTDEGTISWDK